MWQKLSKSGKNGKKWHKGQKMAQVCLPNFTQSEIEMAVGQRKSSFS